MGLSLILLSTLLPVAFAICPGTGSLSDSNVQHVLNIFNLWRGEAAKGELYTDQRQLPAGENIYKMEWDCALEELAKKAVENCPTTKTVNPTNGQSFMHLDSTYTANERAQALNTSLSTWPDAADYTDIGNDIVNMAGDDGMLTFMNMIRANTYQVGCSQKQCGNTATAACFYNQPDLKTGELVFKAGRNCANGGPCTTYPASTCDGTFSLCVRGNVPTTTAAAVTTTTPTTAAPVQAETMPTTTAQNTRCSQNQGMTDVVRGRFLDMHNIRRAGLAAGEATTTNNERMLRSSNMMRLTWDCGMEAAALQHAMACTFAKTDLSTRPNYGENQATIAVASNYQAAAEEAVKQWWKTIRHIGGVGRDRIYQRSFFGTPIDGFTQIAWATTTKLGCAVVKCSGRYNVVCRYNPRGNIVGEEIYKRGRPCSQCPLGTTCLDNLCRFN